MARSLVETLEDKKAEDIVLLDLRGKCSFTDYFIICSGTSERQLDALAESVAETAYKKHRLKSPRFQGHAAGGWILIDFGDVIVHAFSPEQRKRYRLEDFWREARVVVRIQ
ncbi:MAG: ribosome silencing factor [Anaerolineales bacterium]|nr:ribosome silencing factor [Anaerolineales bacterium]